ncbi:MAG TPA: helix-turn-helix domain-containing protein [Ilumatobacter sp.]|nr:helix-turn-helix domain-containing protein [Ilumatobacter sp.]
MGKIDPNDPRRQLDTQALSGLAHPLRVELFQDLTVNGPATATQLAERHHESSGSTSYHLRQLERFGFVETVPELGNLRERWWRRVPGGVLIHTPDRDDDPAGHAAARLVISELYRVRLERLQSWLADGDHESCEVADYNATHLSLTDAEVREMAGELEAVVSRWRTHSEARTEPVDGPRYELQVALFPLPPVGE